VEQQTCGLRASTQNKILGGSCCYFVKSKHLHHSHHQPIIHLPCPCLKGKSNGREHLAAVNNGGVSIKGVGALQQLVTSAINKVRQNSLRTLMWDLLAMWASIYHQLLKQQEGAYDRRINTITQDQKDLMPSNIIPMTCCIILMTVIIVFSANIIAPMTCSRVFIDRNCNVLPIYYDPLIVIFVSIQYLMLNKIVRARFNFD
jgi:hypothetical protein